jgi:phosphoglycerate dehydrogenase-like enzyme
MMPDPRASCPRLWSRVVKLLLSTNDLPDASSELPSEVEVLTWDGTGEPPELDEVDFFVPPYLFGEEVYRHLSRMPRLEVCQTLTAGVDAVLPHLPSGVTLCNAKGLHDASTAELAVALMLASLRGLPDFARAHADGAWLHDVRPSLADRTVLVVGYGSVGAAVERRLVAFETTVLRVARSARDRVASMDQLPALLPQADVVVLTVPMTAETRGMVDARFLSAMQPGALLVNVARGAVVRTDDLLAAVRSGQVRAALDVTDPEPLPPDHPLWREPGVFITPHVGGNTSAFRPRAMKLVVDQVRRYVAGEPLLNVVTGDY